MKKTFVLITALVLVFAIALSGCGNSANSANSGNSANSENTENSESNVVEPEENQEIGNPWTEVKTAEEAAEGAKLDSFNVEGIEISLGKTEPTHYRYTTGIAEAEVPIAAVEMTIRKGDSGQTDFGDSDCSGDYNDYKYNWTYDIDGMEVWCYGNRKGEATKTAWNGEKYSFAVLAYGAGGDDDYGLPKEDVEIMVKSIK